MKSSNHLIRCHLIFNHETLLPRTLQSLQKHFSIYTSGNLVDMSNGNNHNNGGITIINLLKKVKLLYKVSDKGSYSQRFVHDAVFNHQGIEIY